MKVSINTVSDPRVYQARGCVHMTSDQSQTQTGTAAERMILHMKRNYNIQMCVKLFFWLFLSFMPSLILQFNPNKNTLICSQFNHLRFNLVMIFLCIIFFHLM